VSVPTAGRSATIALGLVLCACSSGGCAGTSASSIQPPAGSPTFSPYVDVTLTAPFDLTGVGPDAGARSLTLAFVTAAGGGGCRPAWGAGTAIDAPSIAGPAARLRGAGIGLRVSFGGALGAELARTCTDTSRLARAYAGVLDSFHASAADFDLEGTALADRAALLRRAHAIAAVQASSTRPLAVSVSVPVSPRGGLSADAMEAVRAMLAAGVRLTAVNLLAMDYGAPVHHGGMAAAALMALAAAHRQLAGIASAADPALGQWSALGVTSMIGVNDSPGETFTVADARTVADFAAVHGLGLVSMWSLARDNPCAGSGTVASPTCSGVGESPYAFSRVFGARPKPGVLPRRAVD
jgi:hypothetical protein